MEPFKTEQNSQPDRKPMIKITGLWANKAKDGKQYFSGKPKDGQFAGYRFLVFTNTYYTEGSKQPQLNLLMAEAEGD